jgi:hypothetical protein
MTDLAVAALVRKRAELAGEIEATQARLDQMRSDLVHRQRRSRPWHRA